MKAAQTALSRTALHIYQFLSAPPLPVYGSNSPRLHEQCNGTVRTALSQTAPNSVETSLLQTAGKVMTSGSRTSLFQYSSFMRMQSANFNDNFVLRNFK